MSIEPGRARYVSLTTFRASGEGVSTPVWIAPTVAGLGEPGDLVVISELDTWKVKRLRKDSRVELRPCDMRGRVEADALAQVAAGIAAEPEEVRLVKRAISDKYGWWYHAFAAVERVMVRVRPSYPARAGIIITLDS